MNLMTQNLNLPSNFASLTNEEMTYTEGGSLSALAFLQGTATVVGTLVLGSSFIWGVTQIKKWLDEPDNTDGNFFTVAGRAIDSIGEDMSQSPANCLRDLVAIATMAAVVAVPVGAIISFAQDHAY